MEEIESKPYQMSPEEEPEELQMVFLVWDKTGEDDGEVVGVFSDSERAHNYADEEGEGGELKVVPWGVDEPITIQADSDKFIDHAQSFFKKYGTAHGMKILKKFVVEEDGAWNTTPGNLGVKEAW